ncbi:TonB-dependent receptor [Dokdonia donghaensis]|uniref:TonB-dependent receptor n=1 Tax=Dokdonia donghaensis DSW-1 TaxID=1300343 RepID=A0A0A2GXQ2_9FLAO|nr:Colicin I receptor precursor [Dokdonia donghaensis DSW-1]KGO07116.1 TonB-dependent receptor [Dokdonia donghaensis DSW-1]
MLKVCTFLMLLFSLLMCAQTTITGRVSDSNGPLPFVNVYLANTTLGASSNNDGSFEILNVPDGTYTIIASFTGYESVKKNVTVNGGTITANFFLKQNTTLEEVVISGTLKPVVRKESPVPVEVYSQAFLKKNPVPSVFEALQNVNGVRPQLNCSVCNTGDIHINGLEGPYTLVLIDGMPIVSGLSTVYGLSGIPTSLIERVEVVKGPASSLYGSEAVGGLINVITKIPEQAPRFFVENQLTSWGENNLDIGASFKAGKAHSLVGVNYYNYSNPIDNNNDNFTDVTLQDRISVFNKWSFDRKDDKVFNLAGRFFYEDRWGGELQWTPAFRGGDEIYGESIYTRRFEILGNYQLPTTEDFLLRFSYTDHDQNSVYGNEAYIAQQRIGFTQLTWNKKINKHDLLLAGGIRYNYYDDNTTATFNAGANAEEDVVIPSFLVQDEIKFTDKNTLLLGARYDYDARHGNIFTPRLAYRHKFNEDNILRLNAGTGFRIVSLFAEDHAALTGARDVIITEELDPEQSYNVNLNYLKKIYNRNAILTLDASTWFTHFTNQILPDYDTNPNQIIYSNLNGYSQTYGASVNLDATFTNGIKGSLGVTYQDVSQTEDGVRERQILTESYSANWSLSYKIENLNLNIDYTGSLYGPMRLPILGELDPREEYSPTWSTQNIQLTYDGITNLELYGGVKNLLNYTPNRNNPFIIARADDPFDENVVFDNQGQVVPTADNPNALTFDPNYIFAPNQGIRGFFGIRYTLN